MLGADRFGSGGRIDCWVEYAYGHLERFSEVKDIGAAMDLRKCSEGVGVLIKASPSRLKSKCWSRCQEEGVAKKSLYCNGG